MPEDEEGSVIQDKAMLERVATCEGFREVQHILNEYGETAFSDLVYDLYRYARNYPSKEQHLYIHYTEKERDLIRSHRIALQLEP